MSAGVRPVIIVGNWKMHKTIGETAQFIKALTPLVADAKSKIYLAVPFTAVHAAVQAANGTSIVIGAQNMHDEPEGAFTGEVSGGMLREAGADFVILGHSERRTLFGEKNSFINRKVKQALETELQVVLCIGETEQERLRGSAESVLKEQLEHCLEGVSKEMLQGLVIAYEPVWAIGTGQTATPDQAQEMHAYCRGILEVRFGREASQRIPILYGGSVRPDNIRALIEKTDIDGALVGGASLKTDSFSQIVNYQTTMCK